MSHSGSLAMSSTITGSRKNAAVPHGTRSRPYGLAVNAADEALRQVAYCPMADANSIAIQQQNRAEHARTVGLNQA